MFSTTSLSKMTEAEFDTEGKMMIFQGAEAKVYKYNLNGQEVIEKYRFEKKYRHPDLDKKIRTSRTRSEAKILQKLHQQGISVPQLVASTNFTIIQQFIVGQSLTDIYLKGGLNTEHLRQVGQLVKAIHNAGVVHNDLTFSNIIQNDEGKLIIIDFGLGQITTIIEHRAVDLYVLEKALAALTGNDDYVNEVLSSYGIDEDKELQIRLQQVRARGRKK